MRARTGQRGSVSIYLLIMLLGLFCFIGLLVDLGRISIAQNQLRKAANTAARSLLADYDQGMKDDYGLFAVASAVEDSRKKDFDRYLKANLSGAPAGGFTLLDFRLEESGIVMIRPLDDNNVLKQQILEEMKYRAPLDLTKEVAGRFKELGELFNVFGRAEKEKNSIAGIESKLDELKARNRSIRQLGERRKKLREEIQRKKSRLAELEGRTVSGGQAGRQLGEEISALKDSLNKDSSDYQRLKGEIKEEADRTREIRDQIEEDLTSLEKKDGKGGAAASGGVEGEDKLDLAVKDADRFIEESLEEYTGRLREGLDRDAGGTLDTIDLAEDDVEIDEACLEIGDGKDAGEDSLEEEARKQADEEKSRLEQLKQGPNVELVNSFESASDSSARGLEVIETGEKLLGLINMEKEMLNTRDELFINEFVLSERNGKLRFDNLAANGFDTTAAEAEYIICGSWQSALRQIWLIRFTLDAPAYFVLRFKALGPVWGVVASLAVGAVQASVDTINLIDKKEVGLIEVFPPGSCRLQEIKVNYRDMLRLAAFLESDSDGKLTRIARKIGEKTGADMNESSTAVFGDVTVSVRLWFLPAVGIREMANGPLGTVISGGRCYITKNVEYSY